MYKEFDVLAAERILYYVYALRDPRNKEVFYVGKGESNRWYQHIKEAEKKNDDPTLKLQRIREIHAAEQEVEAFIIRSGISSEKHAYDVEAAVVHAYRLLERAGRPLPLTLTNIAEIHHPERGLASIAAMQSLLNAQPAPEITEPVGIFKIGVRWYPDMSEEQIRETTSGWWSASRVKKGMRIAKYAFGVSDGIIRGVYRIDESLWRERVKGDRDWENDLGKTPRWGFPGCESASEMSHFMNTSVKHLFKRGDQNSVKFINCDWNR